LKDPGKHKKHPFGEFVHGKCFMRSIPVQKKCLKKQGEVPMRYKKNQNLFHVKSFGLR